MVAYNLGGVFISSDSALQEIQAVAMEPEEGSRSTETPGVVNRGFQADEAASSAPRPGQGSGGGEGDQDQDQLGDCALLGLDLGCLNMFRGPKWFLVFLSLAAFMQGLCINGSAANRSIGSTTGCTITEKVATRAFSWLKAPTSAFTFKTLLRHYAKMLIFLPL